MKDLIDGNGRWDTEKVCMFFSNRDAALILYMRCHMIMWRISIFGPTRKMANQRLDQSTTDSVRSMPTTRHNKNRTSNGIWKAIWGANVVPKVKNYMWRLATNAVAVKGNLIRWDRMWTRVARYVDR